MDQKGMTFDPHILVVTAGDSVNFHNHDKIDHNIFSSEGGYDLGALGRSFAAHLEQLSP